MYTEYIAGCGIGVEVAICCPKEVLGCLKELLLKSLSFFWISKLKLSCGGAMIDASLLI
jgi:hypothetical protein